MKRAGRFILGHLRFAAILLEDSWIRVDTPKYRPGGRPGRCAQMRGRRRSMSSWPAASTS